METQGVLLLLLLLLCAVSTCWGQVSLTLGSGPVITTNNVDIQITSIGEGTSLSSLICHTDLTACCRSVADNNGNGGLGQWVYPDGSVILGNGYSATAGQQFYINRNGAQIIGLNRRETTNPVTPTGSYCCTVPTTGGDMTLCTNLVAPTSVTCSDNLPAPTNGGITYAGGSTNSRPVGATASYNCVNLYRLVGVSVRTCGSDGEWSSTPAPVCQMITCSDLPSLTNGGIDYGGAGSNNIRPVNTVVSYTCDTHYTLTGGSTTRTCESDGVWSGSAPVCQMNTGSTTCSDLIVPTNGMIGYTMGTASPRPLGTVATYTCDTGYTRIEGSFRSCQNDGTWDGTTPTCQLNTVPTEPPTTCPDLTVPANGMISYNMGTTRPVGTVATYTCDTGYTLNGDITRTCGSNGGWSGSATTCIVSCGSPPTVSNGVRTSSTGTTFGAMATYSCNTGYQRSGSATITCEASRSWSTAPVCTAICPDLPLLVNGLISYSSTSTPRLEGAVVRHFCLTGYQLFSSTATRTCQSDRTWSGAPLTCQCLIIVMSEALSDDSMFSVLMVATVWEVDQFYSIYCRQDTSKMYFPWFFFLYHFLPYAYFVRFNGQLWFLPFLFHWLMTQHAMLFFINHFELPMNRQRRGHQINVRLPHAPVVLPHFLGLQPELIPAQQVMRFNVRFRGQQPNIEVQHIVGNAPGNPPPPPQDGANQPEPPIIPQENTNVRDDSATRLPTSQATARTEEGTLRRRNVSAVVGEATLAEEVDPRGTSEFVSGSSITVPARRHANDLTNCQDPGDDLLPSQSTLRQEAFTRENIRAARLSRFERTSVEEDPNSPYIDQ